MASAKVDRNFHRIDHRFTGHRQIADGVCIPSRNLRNSRNSGRISLAPQGHHRQCRENHQKGVGNFGGVIRHVNLSKFNTRHDGDPN